jgi:hypothetical protein
MGLDSLPHGQAVAAGDGDHAVPVELVRDAKAAEALLQGVEQE